MSRLFETSLARLWNLALSEPREERIEGLHLGSQVRDGIVTEHPVLLPQVKRAEHIALLGKTGTGKSTLLRSSAHQDVRERQGFAFVDLHSDTTPSLLQAVAMEEQKSGRDLSSRLVIVEPGDVTCTVGLNILERTAGQLGFVHVAEVAAILKQRWGLDSFGARTEELLRNALLVLCENDLTLLEIGPLLSSASFRARCLRQVKNPEVRSYFETRYNAASAAMQATLNGPVLNKLTVFTADPHFRHILGQQRSTLSIADALDKGLWIVLNLDKGRLGEQALTLASLFVTKLKDTLFSRQHRQLFTVYCDEVQNLVASESALEVLFSEARKFGVGVISANQFLEQYPAHMRSAILAVGTHIFFQLSGPDANQIANFLDGGKHLAETLKNLPQRQFILKSGHHPWLRVLAPTPNLENVDFSDLRSRCLRRWARKRSEIEQEIQSRQPASRDNDEVLRDWD
jgi:hypothetical protein